MIRKLTEAKTAINVIVGLTTLIIVGFFAKGLINKKAKSGIIIGILQTASHPALDQARDGFVEHLKKELGCKVDFVFQNAQGSISNAHQIAKNFHINKKIDGIFSIATPAAQAMAHVEKTKPVFFSAITDPHSLGLIHPKTNLCGSTDMIDVKGEIETLKLLLPNVKKVALLFNPAEVNSVTLIKKMKKELEKNDLIPIEIGINTESEVVCATTIACKKADALLAPTDNTVALTIQSIANIALKNKKPLIVSDNFLVKHGALFAQGVNYKKSGRQAAQQAIEVFVKNKKPADLPLKKPEKTHPFINKKVLKRLGLLLPKKLKTVTFV